MVYLFWVAEPYAWNSLLLYLFRKASVFMFSQAVDNKLSTYMKA